MWTPRSHSAVVPLVAVPAVLLGDGDSDTTLAPTDAISAEDGLHFRLRAGRVDAQLLLLDGSGPPRPLAALVPLDADALDRIAAVERLWRSLHGRAVSPERGPTTQQRNLLRQELRATDGRAHGATYREIAEAMFGAARVADHPWKSSPLRDKIYRLVRGGRAMINGGYRTFLRRLRPL